MSANLLFDCLNGPELLQTIGRKRVALNIVWGKKKKKKNIYIYMYLVMLIRTYQK